MLSVSIRRLSWHEILCLLCFFIHGEVGAALSFPGVPGPPATNAKSYLLVDANSGAVLVEHAPDTPMEPASLTKIMTTYVVAHALREGMATLSDEVTVSEKAWKIGGSRMFVEVDTKVTIEALLHGVIVQSGNDASVALAEHISGSEEVFAAEMNQHAARLGMSNSSFANSTGWPDPGTYATARDLATLSRALIREFPDIYVLFKLPSYTYNGIKQANRNGLLARDPSVDGIKTGHTEAAGYCLITSAVRDGMRLISVVLGSDSDAARIDASRALLNYGYRFFETKRLYDAGAEVARGKVWKGVRDEVGMALGADLFVTFPRGKQADLSAKVNMVRGLAAPIVSGQTVSELQVSFADQAIARVPLLAVSDVEPGSLLKRATDFVRLLLE